MTLFPLSAENMGTLACALMRNIGPVPWPDPDTYSPSRASDPHVLDSALLLACRTFTKQAVLLIGFA